MPLLGGSRRDRHVNLESHRRIVTTRPTFGAGLVHGRPNTGVDMDHAFSKQLSCGIVIVNPHRELLLCHVTGQHHWDLPKGRREPGESPLQAALRETREETGLDFDASALVELGRYDYRPRKALHLYATLLPRIELTALRCESFFQLSAGRHLPEMDGYGWFGFDRLAHHCTARMSTVLAVHIDLAQVLQDLLVTKQPSLAA